MLASFVRARSLSAKKVSPDKRILRRFEGDDLVIELNECISDKPADTERITFKYKFAISEDLMAQHGWRQIQQHQIDALTDHPFQFNRVLQLNLQGICSNRRRVDI